MHPTLTRRDPPVAPLALPTRYRRRSRLPAPAWFAVAALCAVPAALAFVGLPILAPLALVGVALGGAYAVLRTLDLGPHVSLSGSPLVQHLVPALEDLRDVDGVAALLCWPAEPLEVTARDLPDGVEVCFRSPDRDVALRSHERALTLIEALLLGAAPTPATATEHAIAANTGAVRVTIDRLPDGLRLRERARDPRLAHLLQQHAREALCEAPAESRERRVV